MDIRTPKEKERDERNRRIRNDFKMLRSENPDAKDYRLFSILAKQYKLSWMSIRNIVIETTC